MCPFSCACRPNIPSNQIWLILRFNNILTSRSLNSLWICCVFQGWNKASELRQAGDAAPRKQTEQLCLEKGKGNVCVHSPGLGVVFQPVGGSLAKETPLERWFGIESPSHCQPRGANGAWQFWEAGFVFHHVPDIPPRAAREGNASPAALGPGMVLSSKGGAGGSIPKWDVGK